MDTAPPFLAELFQAHRRGLAGAVRTVLGPMADVTEVLQDSFLKCWRNWQQGTRPNDPVAWMFVVTWNTATDARRRRQRLPAHHPFEEEGNVSASDRSSPSQALERQEAVVRAQAAVAQLDDAHQQVFLLRVGGELSFAAVAEALAIPIGTAKTRMRRALQQLRSALGVGVGKEQS